MKALLTGITGNLGHEVALDLVRRGFEIIPIVRPGKGGINAAFPVHCARVVESDLSRDERVEFVGAANCIVHCAGVVHFRDAGTANQTMLRNVLRLAESLKIPLYLVSTAFVYRPLGESLDFNNSYEEDKYRAEQVLSASGVPHAIFRPSVLSGHSRTGKIQNFSGYYAFIGAFLLAVRFAAKNKRRLRFPRMMGTTDMVPVDQAAECMGEVIQKGSSETFYITNPAPPRSHWVLNETLNFYGVRNTVDIIDISFKEFGNIALSEEELKLYRFASHFAPYWSIQYDFPRSLCINNLITKEYLATALSYFRDSENTAHAQRNH